MSENPIQPMVEQLYQNEALTDALTDDAAKLLLQWGEQQLNNLAGLSLSPENLDSAGQALQKAMRAANRLIEQRADLSDVEMIEHLLKLVEQVITLTLIAQQSMPVEETHDQEA